MNSNEKIKPPPFMDNRIKQKKEDIWKVRKDIVYDIECEQEQYNSQVFKTAFTRQRYIEEHKRYRQIYNCDPKNAIVGPMAEDYSSGKYTYRQLAEKYGRSIGGISYLFKTRNIKVPERNHQYEREYPYWIKLKKSGKSLCEISRITGIGKTTLSYFFRSIYPKWIKENPQYL